MKMFLAGALSVWGFHSLENGREWLGVVQLCVAGLAVLVDVLDRP